MPARYENFQQVLDRWVPYRPAGECWEWAGYKLVGYGYVTYLGTHWRAPRLVYTELVGPIPDGLHIRHRCDNPPCVNPEHLEVGTHADNMHDRDERGRARGGNSYKTHCIRGHEFDEANTYWWAGERRCRKCHRQYEKNRRDRIKRERATTT